VNFVLYLLRYSLIRRYNNAIETMLYPVNGKTTAIATSNLIWY